MFKSVVLLSILGAALGLPASVPDGRIIGGHEADIAEYPWTLALQLYNQQYCGAVLVDVQWAFTTAHCVEHGITEGLTVRAGSSLKNFGGEVVDVFRVVFHERYDPETVDFDFALLELAAPITVPEARPVDLPEHGHPVVAGEIGHVSGWGTLGRDAPAPDHLHAVEVPIIGREECARIYGTRLTEVMFCAGPEDGGRDACEGDSGGPVVIDLHLAGLISWGPTDCGLRGYPGVYAYVSQVRNWMIEVMINSEPEPEPEPIPESVIEV